MTQKIGLEVANGYIKVVSDDSEAVYPNRLKMLTGSEFSLTGTIGTVYEFNNKKNICSHMHPYTHIVDDRM